MIPLTPWIERTFDWTPSLGVFRAILERLRGTPARLVDKLSEFEAAALTARTDGRWSMQEHAGHLIELEKLWQTRIEEFIYFAPRLAPADMSNRGTNEAGYNQMPISSILIRFRQQRMQTIGMLEDLDEDIVGRLSFHPRLRKNIRLLDLMIFMSEHDDHHLAVIQNLIEHRNKSQISTFENP